jgi:tellurite resistance-related uncharacterized protein
MSRVRFFHTPLSLFFPVYPLSTPHVVQRRFNAFILSLKVYFICNISFQPTLTLLRMKHATYCYTNTLCARAINTVMDQRDCARLYMATPSGCRNAPGVNPRLCVMQGAIRYYGYADETSPQPVETLTIEAGQFGVFPAEKWHRIEALSDDTVFNVDFWVDPNVLIEG